VIVLDASAMVRMLVDDPPDPDLGVVLAANEIHAPTLLDYEVGSALRGHALGGLITARRLGRALEDYADFQVNQHAMSGAMAPMLALRDNFTLYDAAYLVLALALGAPLVTADAKHLKAERLGVDVRLFASP
jgi:predicted nucleic acid-binding protein